MINRIFKRKPLVNVLRLSGTIGTSIRPGASGLSDATLAPLIERAFTRGRPRAVALAINSPGGSAVQSSLIAARIRALSVENDVPVHAFCEDVAASGGYWLATAADHIYADESSMIGSIGVIAASFGLKEFIARHGIERRVHTAGANKAFWDTFEAESDRDVERLNAMLTAIHARFVEQVKARRGARLKGDNLFEGDVWVGQEAVDNGLIDGIAHLRPRMRQLFGDKLRFREITPPRGLLGRFAAHAAGGAITAIEDRALWARFGL